MNRHSIDQDKRSLAVYDGTAPTKGTKEYREWRKPGIVLTDPNMALTTAEFAICLMREESLIDMSLARLHRLASKYSLQLGEVDKAKSHAMHEAEAEKMCLGTETAYLDEKALTEGGGNAAAWTREIERIVEREGVKIRMCQKRVLKANKKAEKKAAKKKGKK